jgi:hypothetical protein
MMPKLIDAFEMHRLYPKTFNRLSPDEIDLIRPGDHVKVGVNFDPAVKLSDQRGAGRSLWLAKAGEAQFNKTDGERFWVIVTEIGAEPTARRRFKGTVDNDLVYTENHGYAYKSVIEFEARNLLSREPPK